MHNCNPTSASPSIKGERATKVHPKYSSFSFNNDLLGPFLFLLYPTPNPLPSSLPPLDYFVANSCLHITLYLS